MKVGSKSCIRFRRTGTGNFFFVRLILLQPPETNTFCFIASIRKVIRKPYKGVVTRWNSDHAEVKHTNLFMGDLQAALAIMLSKDGVDKKKLVDADGNEVDKRAYHFTDKEERILQQYECAAEPVLLLSKFFQINKPSAHLVLIHLRVRINEMRQPRFDKYADISYSSMEVLTNRRKTETVVRDNIEDRRQRQIGKIEVMEDCIYDFRYMFADNLEYRCHLVDVDEKGHHIEAENLPEDMAVACLLHPLLGGEYCSHFVWQH